MHQARPLGDERLLLARDQCRPLELLALRAQERALLDRRGAHRLRLRERVTGGQEAARALPHLLEGAAETADCVEQLAMALDAAERLMLVLSVDAQQVRRQVTQEGERSEGPFT